LNQEISISWKDGMAFEADVNDHKFMLDAGENVGGRNKGPRPKPLMLVALAGCTGMDVVSILKEMRVEVDNFDVKVEASQSEEQPVHYTSIHIIYVFWGKDLPYEKIEKAINLSQERYCGVSVVYKKIMTVTYSIVIHQSDKQDKRIDFIRKIN
jgi:putative redox protein